MDRSRGTARQKGTVEGRQKGKVKMDFIAFTNSYLVKGSFRAVALLVPKQRNRLKVTGQGDLLLSELQPEVEHNHLITLTVMSRNNVTMDSGC